MKPRKLSTILAGTQGDLARLLDRAEKIAGLTGLVRDALPEPVADHVVAASLRDGCLTVLADSPVWAARLRFVDPALGERLKEFGVSAERIQIRVRAPGERPDD